MSGLQAFHIESDLEEVAGSTVGTRGGCRWGNVCTELTFTLKTTTDKLPLFSWCLHSNSGHVLHQFIISLFYCMVLFRWGCCYSCTASTVTSLFSFRVILCTASNERNIWTFSTDHDAAISVVVFFSCGGIKNGCAKQLYSSDCVWPFKSSGFGVANLMMLCFKMSHKHLLCSMNVKGSSWIHVYQ